MQIKDFPVYLTMREKGATAPVGDYVEAPNDVYTATYHEGETLAEDTMEKPCLRFGTPHCDEQAAGPFPVSGEPVVALITKNRGHGQGWMFSLDREGDPPTELHLQYSREARLAPGGNAVVLSDRRQLESFDVKSGNVDTLCKLPPNQVVRDLAINRDGSRVLVALRDEEDDGGAADELDWFDRATGELQTIQLEDEPAVEQMALSPDGHTLAALNEGRLQMIDLSTGKSRALEISDGPGYVRGVAFTPDGTRLLCDRIDPGTDGCYTHSRLYAVSPQGGPPRLLLSNDDLLSAYPTAAEQSMQHPQCGN